MKQVYKIVTQSIFLFVSLYLFMYFFNRTIFEIFQDYGEKFSFKILRLQMQEYCHPLSCWLPIRFFNP